jgi:ribonuclease VapC
VKCIISFSEKGGRKEQIIFSNAFDDVIQAARIKAEYPLSFADCFAVATARKNNSVIMTGDPEFKRIENLVTVEWIDK